MASVSAGKEERGAAGDLALSGCEAEQEKGPLRWEFRSRPGGSWRPGEGGAAVSGRDGEAVGEPAFSPWPESKSSGKLYLPEDEKTVRKIPCFKGAFYRLAGPSMIALWLIFQPPPRAVYRETSVLACW